VLTVHDVAIDLAGLPFQDLRTRQEIEDLTLRLEASQFTNHHPAFKTRSLFRDFEKWEERRIWLSEMDDSVMDEPLPDTWPAFLNDTMAKLNQLPDALTLPGSTLTAGRAKNILKATEQRTKEEGKLPPQAKKLLDDAKSGENTDMLTQLSWVASMFVEDPSADNASDGFLAIASVSSTNGNDSKAGDDAAVNATKGGSGPKGQSFETAMKKFLDNPRYNHYARDIHWEKDGKGNDRVRRARFTICTKALSGWGDGTDKGQMMLDYRRIIGDSSLHDDAFAYNPSFFFYERNISVLPMTIWNLVVVAAAVVIVTFLFIPDPAVVFIVLLMLVLLDVELLGMMSFWGIDLNFISLINLVMATGFAVDYIAHVAHAFVQHKGPPKERLQHALKGMGVAVAHGGISTLCAMMPVGLSSAYLFRLFFRMFILTCFLGLAHGLLFLPLVLSLVRAKGHTVCTRRSKGKRALKRPALKDGTIASSLSRRDVTPATPDVDEIDGYSTKDTTSVTSAKACVEEARMEAATDHEQAILPPRVVDERPSDQSSFVGEPEQESVVGEGEGEGERQDMDAVCVTPRDPSTIVCPSDHGTTVSVPPLTLRMERPAIPSPLLPPPSIALSDADDDDSDDEDDDAPSPPSNCPDTPSAIFSALVSPIHRSSRSRRHVTATSPVVLSYLRNAVDRDASQPLPIHLSSPALPCKSRVRRHRRYRREDVPEIALPPCVVEESTTEVANSGWANDTGGAASALALQPAARLEGRHRRRRASRAMLEDGHPPVEGEGGKTDKRHKKHRKDSRRRHRSVDVVVRWDANSAEPRPVTPRPPRRSRTRGREKGKGRGDGGTKANNTKNNENVTSGGEEGPTAAHAEGGMAERCHDVTADVWDV